MTASGGLVRYEVDGGVGVLSFNRPERHNALNDAMGAEWRAALLDALADRDVRVLLLRGEGPSFSSGRDTAELGKRTGGEGDLSFVRRHQDTRLAMLDAPKPIVAAVRGYALGGAFETALACDVRIAATDARFGLPEIGYGLLADTGGTQLLTVLAGPSRAKWLLVSGERIDAETALRWGIVDWVVAPEELDERALTVCRTLAAAPADAVAMAKQLVDSVWAGTIRTGMRQELLAQTALFAQKKLDRGT